MIEYDPDTRWAIDYNADDWSSHRLDKDLKEVNFCDIKLYQTNNKWVVVSLTQSSY